MNVFFQFLKIGARANGKVGSKYFISKTTIPRLEYASVLFLCPNWKKQKIKRNYCIFSVWNYNYVRRKTEVTDKQTMNIQARNMWVVLAGFFVFMGTQKRGEKRLINIYYSFRVKVRTRLIWLTTWTCPVSCYNFVCYLMYFESTWI